MWGLNHLKQISCCFSDVCFGVFCTFGWLKLRSMFEATPALVTLCVSPSGTPNSQHKSLKTWTSDVRAQTHTCAHTHGTSRCLPIVVTHLGDLDTPVEQQLWADVVLVLVHVVEQAAVGHELGDQLDGGTQADSQQTHQVGVFHAGHYQGLLGKGGQRQTKRGLRRLASFRNGPSSTGLSSNVLAQLR